MIRHTHVAAALLALLVVAAPLPFGSVTPGFAAALQVAVFLATALALVLGPESHPTPGTRQAVAAIAGIAAFGVAQSFAWPIGWVELLSPEHARLARETAALLGATAPARAPLSVAPEASRSAALDWLLAAAALALAARVGAARTVRRALLAGLLGSAAFQILYGARQWFARSSEIWGVETPLQALRLRGTFVNPNHLALLLEIALAAATAWLAWSLRRARRESSAERRLARAAAPFVVWIALFAGLAFTGSRAGLLAAVAGVAVAATLVTRGRRGRALAALAAGLVVAAVALALFGAESLFARLLATPSGDASAAARLTASARTLELAARFPATGVGLGGFLVAFPFVQSADLEGVWRHAHDDWAELAATAGLAGIALAVAGLAGIARALAASWRTAARSEDRAAVVAAVGALAAVAIHSALDFGLTLPANALALALVVGAACAAGGVPEKSSPP